MTQTVVNRIWVQGTPRGYGNKNAREWLDELEAALKEHRNRKQNDSEETRYEVNLSFHIFPKSSKYRGQNLPHGTDLDNLVKQTIDGFDDLCILTDDKAIYRIAATKEHVESDEETGVWVVVRTL